MKPIRIRYYDRKLNAIRQLDVKTDCVDIIIPEQEDQPALSVTVNTDAVSVQKSDVAGKLPILISRHDFIDLLADADME